MSNGFLSALVKAFTVASILTGASLGPLWGQGTNSCPDWSPKFDQIQESAVRQALQSERAAGWPQVAAAASNPSQAFTAGNQIIATAQSNIQSDRQGLQQIAVGNPGPVTENMCKSNISASGNAVLAYQCNILTMQDMILATQGTLELLQCRSGFKGTIGSGAIGSGAIRSGPFGGGPAGGSSRATMSDLLHSLTGANSPTPLASQSHFQDFEDHRSNSAVVGDTAGQEQADASSNASRLAANDKAIDPLNSEVDAALATNGNTDSSRQDSLPHDTNIPTVSNSEWDDPQSEAPSEPDQAYPLPTQDEIAHTLNKGISNLEETSATPVAAVSGSSQWEQFSSEAPGYSSPAASSSPDGNSPVRDATDEQIDRDMRLAGVDKKALAKILPTNDISDAFIDQGIGAIGAVAHQMNRTLNDASSGLFNSDVSPAQISSDIEGFGPALGDALVPDKLKALAQDASKVQSYVTKKVQTISCLFSFDPYCK